MLQGQITEVLSFSPLSLSDAGRYTCEVIVTADSETFTAYQNHSVIIQSELISWYIVSGCMMSLSCCVVPAPTSVSVTSDLPNPIRPVGSTVTVTCTVVLAEYVDSLTVNTELTGPNEYTDNGMAQHMGSTSTYTSTAMVSSFGRDQSGNYTCTATVSSKSSFYFITGTHNTSFGTTDLTTGGYKYLLSSVNNTVIIVLSIHFMPQFLCSGNLWLRIYVCTVHAIIHYSANIRE